MQTPYPGLPAGKLAYIRQIDRDGLPVEIRTQIPGDTPIWGIHTPNGEVLALARNRAVAFALARQNDLSPVSAH